MRLPTLLFTFLAFSCTAFSQEEKDSTLIHCPVFITDTVSANNFFIEARPAQLKVYRVRGKLTIQVEQKDQFFTLYFHDKKLKNGSYRILAGSRGKNEVEAAYSFRSGDQSSFIAVSRGNIDIRYDEAVQHWQLKIAGLIINQVERSSTHYKVRSELWIK